MQISRDTDNAPEGVEVLLFCLVKGAQVATLARPAWVDELQHGKVTTTRVLRWQSTWDGSEIPQGWTPYAYATFEAPDPAA